MGFGIGVWDWGLGLGFGTGVSMIISYIIQALKEESTKLGILKTILSKTSDDTSICYTQYSHSKYLYKKGIRLNKVKELIDI